MKNETQLYVLDWQIRNVLRLKKELKNADSKRATKILREIKNLYNNMAYLDPDKTKRFELLSLYFRQHLHTEGCKKRLSLLLHSLSDFIFSCGSDVQLDSNLLYKKLLEYKTTEQPVQNSPIQHHLHTRPALTKLTPSQLMHD